MTPKEKANELVVKFIRYMPAEEEFELPYAKKCALIAVDEIIKEYEVQLHQLGLKTLIAYWKIVKAEIEKL